MKVFRCASFVGAFLLLAAPGVQADDSIKIGLIDPQSGPFAALGAESAEQFEYAIDYFAKDGVLGGKKIEFQAFDNKQSPKESLVQLKNAIGQGVRIIVQGNGSSVASALISAIEKHNKRNPDQRVMYLNFSAVDPVLTNEKCSFWHFRYDANSDMKMNAVTDAIAERKDIKKIYLIGQDYSFGKAVAAAAEKFLAEKRPDIEIVGNELHPIGKVKDFTPYVTKIKASGADAVITGNWGADMVNLARAADSAGLDLPFYTYYAAGTGITAAIGKGGVGRIRMIGEGRINPGMTKVWDEYRDGFKAKHPKGDVNQPRIVNVVQTLVAAIEKAGSSKPIDIARALEGMEFTTLAGDKMIMRAKDHQIQMPIQIMVHTDKDVKYDYDNSGFGLYTETSVPLERNVLPTTCEMQRPKA